MEDNQNTTQQPVQDPPTPKKHPRHKLLLTLILLAAVAYTAAGVYFILNQPQDLGPIMVNHKAKPVQQSTATSTQTQIDSSNWQTYNNSNLDFQIKYPPDWTYQEVTDDNGTISFVRFYPSGETAGYLYIGDITVATSINPKQLDLKTFYQTQIPNPFDESDSQTALIINGYPAEKFMGLQANINYDEYSINKGSIIVELTDNGQKHESDGLAAAMTNSIK